MGEEVPHNREILEPSIGLGDDVTVNKLQFIERLHAIGVSKYIALPQLVVVGGQSSGKSSVLQAITRLPFPVQETLCTRFATEVSLRRVPGPESLSVKIKRPDGQEPETLNVPEFENSPFGSPEFRTEFANLLATASRQILGSQFESQALSHATLHITAQGPNQINLTVVDLPGLVSATHPSSKDARNLVDRYIDNPRSIVLAVVVPDDPDTQEVLQIIRNIPDKENRVIGVMNKCDRRQEGADHWVGILYDYDQFKATDRFRSWTQLEMRDVQATACTYLVVGLGCGTASQARQTRQTRTGTESSKLSSRKAFGQI